MRRIAVIIAEPEKELVRQYGALAIRGEPHEAIVAALRATNLGGTGFTQTLSADGLTLTQDFRGPTPVDLSPALAQQLGLPAVFVFSGHIVVVLDNQGNVISSSMTGHMQADLCTALS